MSLVKEPDDKDTGLTSWVPTWDDVVINMNLVTYYKIRHVKLVTYKEYQDLIKEEESE